MKQPTYVYLILTDLIPNERLLLTLASFAVEFLRQAITKLFRTSSFTTSRRKPAASDSRFIFTSSTARAAIIVPPAAIHYFSNQHSTIPNLARQTLFWFTAVRLSLAT